MELTDYQIAKQYREIAWTKGAQTAEDAYILGYRAALAATPGPSEPEASGNAIRDFEWIGAFQEIDSQIAFTGNPKAYVDAVLAPMRRLLKAESELAVRLRNLCEELKPGSSSHITSEGDNAFTPGPREPELG